MGSASGLSEFELIARYFSRCGAARGDVRIGVGDDGAVLAPADSLLASWIADTGPLSLENLASDQAHEVGRDLMARGCEGLRAAGGEPCWATIALTVPETRETFLAPFSGGLDEEARLRGVALVGGDTTQGPARAALFVLGPRQRDVLRD